MKVPQENEHIHAFLGIQASALRDPNGHIGNGEVPRKTQSQTNLRWSGSRYAQVEPRRGLARGIPSISGTSIGLTDISRKNPVMSNTL